VSPGQPATTLAGLAAWAERFLDEIGYFAELKRSEKNPESAEARIRNLRELAASLDRAGDATVPAPASPLDLA
jgi:superfamily I DNA/RNA helicase